MRSDALPLAVRSYRVMAYVTGVVLMVLCFVGIPLQVFAHNLVVVKYVGTAHGFLYIVYIIVAFVMTRLVGMKVASPSTVIVLAAGTIPVLTFVVERWITRRYINPALAAAQTARASAGPAGQGQVADRQAAADRRTAADLWAEAHGQTAARASRPGPGSG